MALTGVVGTALLLVAAYPRTDVAATAAAESQQPEPTRPARTTQPPTLSPTPSRTEALPMPTKGSGRFDVAIGHTRQVGRSQNVVAYRVEVETNVPVSADSFAKNVDSTLGDRRGWTKSGRYSFERNPEAKLRIVLATPQTVDQLCAPLQTRGEVSCRNGNVVAINALRWAEGAKSYAHDLAGYRIYVINHEVGHSLGFSHATCPIKGAKAPVMLQQTLGLQGCKRNPWPQ